MKSNKRHFMATIVVGALFANFSAYAHEDLTALVDMDGYSKISAARMEFTTTKTYDVYWSTITNLEECFQKAEEAMITADKRGWAKCFEADGSIAISFDLWDWTEGTEIADIKGKKKLPLLSTARGAKRVELK